VSLVPALRNGALFQKPVTNYAADIALSCRKICSVFEDSSIKKKNRKTLAVFLHGSTKGNSVYRSALQRVVMTSFPSCSYVSLPHTVINFSYEAEDESCENF